MKPYDKLIKVWDEQANHIYCSDNELVLGEKLQLKQHQIDNLDMKCFDPIRVRSGVIRGLRINTAD